MDDKRSPDVEPPHYPPAKDISPTALRTALTGLTFLGGDPYMSMQALNLAIVDQFLMQLEEGVRKKFLQDDDLPRAEALFLSAQSQMWIFAAYELMRTWRERANGIIAWSEKGILEDKLKELREKHQGYVHIGKEYRASQLKRVLSEPALVDAARNDLKRAYIVFRRMEAIRISLAKHEVKGRRHSVALMPGHGRINQWSGAMDYELEDGANSMGVISRRDIAEELRRLGTDHSVPSDETLRDFDEFMRGPPLEED